MRGMVFLGNRNVAATALVLFSLAGLAKTVTAETITDSATSQGAFCTESDFSPWSQWSSCSVTCGDGSRSRTRDCNGAVMSGVEKCKQTPCDNEPRQDFECSTSIEISFLIDTSGSVGLENFRLIQHFTKDVTVELKKGYQRLNLTIITFNDEAQLILSLNESSKIEELITAEEKIVYTHGGTETHKALQLLYQSVLRNDTTDPKVVIVITDGSSWHPDLTKAAAEELKKSGVLIYVVGVGDDANPYELSVISSDPDEKYLYRLDNFGELSSLIGLFSHRKCSVTTTTSAPTTIIMTSLPTTTITELSNETTYQGTEGTKAPMPVSALTPTGRPAIVATEIPTLKPSLATARKSETLSPPTQQHVEGSAKTSPSSLGTRYTTLTKKPFTKTAVMMSTPSTSEPLTKEPIPRTIPEIITASSAITRKQTSASTAKTSKVTTLSVPTTQTTTDISQTTITTEFPETTAMKYFPQTTIVKQSTETNGTATVTQKTTTSEVSAQKITIKITEVPTTRVPKLTTPTHVSDMKTTAYVPENTTKENSPETTTTPSVPDITTTATIPEISTMAYIQEITTTAKVTKLSTPINIPGITTITNVPDITTKTNVPEITTAANVQEITNKPEVTATENLAKVTTPANVPDITTTKTLPVLTNTTNIPVTTIPSTQNETRSSVATTITSEIFTKTETKASTPVTTLTPKPTAPEMSEVQKIPSSAAQTTTTEENLVEPTSLFPTSASITTRSSETLTTTTHIPETTIKLSHKPAETSNFPTSAETSSIKNTLPQTTITHIPNIFTQKYSSTNSPKSTSTSKEETLPDITITLPPTTRTEPAGTSNFPTSAETSSIENTLSQTTMTHIPNIFTQKYLSTNSLISTPTSKEETLPDITITLPSTTRIEPALQEITSTQPPTTTTPSCIAKVADVVFVVDSSGSIGRPNFEKIKAFIKDVILTFDVDPRYTRVGLIEFSTYPKIEFKLHEKTNLTDLLDAVDNITYSGGGTSTSDALELMRIEGFDRERPLAPDVAVVITDGLSKFPQLTRVQAQLARSDGIAIFSIGIGNETSSEELQAIASSPRYVFEVGDYQTLFTLDSVVAHRACGVELPEEYHTRSSTPSTTTRKGCYDIDAQCPSYPRDSCSDFEPWARKNCPRKCGFCPGFPLVEPPCEDTIGNCAQYGTDMCSSTSQYEWVDTHCRKFCGFCGNKTDITTTTTTPSTTVSTATTCSDLLPNCSKYGGPSMCQTYGDWAKVRCAKYCEFCFNYITVPSTTVNKIRCPKWKLPDVCTIDDSDGSCCPMPICPPNIILTVKRH